MDNAQDRRNIVLLAIVAIIVVYIAVSVYGVIRDIGTGETVFVISSGIPKTENVDRVTPLLDKIKAIFNPPAQVIVPIQKLVTIKGRVVYTNGTPYANGLVRLQSQSRTTYTDGDGYFIFEKVEDGEHTISVLNSSLQVLASAEVKINRDIQIADAVLVKMDVDTFVLEVAVDVKVLEIVLEIEQNEKGEIIGTLELNPELEVIERYTPEEVITPPKEPDKPTEPQVPPDKPVIPEPQPPEPPKGSGGGSKPPSPGHGDLTVYSTNNTGDKFGKEFGAANINIFGDSGLIAPGMTGAYKFTVDNTANSFAIWYDITLEETNNSLTIPMRYRLKNNSTNSYVNGDLNWHTPAEISAITADTTSPLSLTDSRKTEYTLEWKWVEGLNDNSYAAHAGEEVCTLTIRVTAQKK